MDERKLKDVGIGICIGLIYTAAYWILWNASFTQWFLPAGLRVAALVFFPIKRWPYIFAGDVCALLTLRIPKADDYSYQWAYLSPFLLMASITAVVYGIRKKFRSIIELNKWLPLIAIYVAFCGSVSNLAVNELLAGPPLTVGVFERLLRVSVGYYSGIILFLVAGIIWGQRKLIDLGNAYFLRDLTICVTLSAAACYFIRFNVESNNYLKQILLLLMLLPAVLLTYLHGWKGAAMSLIIANIAIAQTLPYANFPGTYDEAVFITQTALVLVGSALLVLGEKISHLYDKAKLLGISEKHAIEMTRSSLLLGENNLREQVLYMAQMQVYMDDQRRQLVQLFRDQGRYQDAMMLNSTAVEHMQSFESRATAIYPLRIEELGLYGVIFPESFTDFWAGDAEVVFLRATGQPKGLSVDLQLSAYRCICNAFTLLAQGLPSQYVVKIRSWKRKSRQGLLIKITSKPTQSIHMTRSGALAEIDLERRVKAYDGTLGRRRMHCVHMLLSEAAIH